MQKDETVGRVLLAGLHQAIAEILPVRLEFYETWLKPSDLHQQTIGLSALLAVLSFLRREDDAYGIVLARAGHYAAMWSFEELGGMRRAFVRALPRRMRVRATSRLMRETLRGLYPESRVEIAWRGSTLFVDLQGSPFCMAPEPTYQSVCGFYAGAIVAFFRLFNLDAAVRVSRCRAPGATNCLLLVLIDSAHAVAGARTSSTLGLASAPPEKPVPEATMQTVTEMKAAMTMSVEVESVTALEPVETPASERRTEHAEAAKAAPLVEAGSAAKAATAEPHVAEASAAQAEPAPVPVPQAGPASAPGARAQPAPAPVPVPQPEAPQVERGRAEPARMDRAEIEAQWARIEAKEPATSEPKELKHPKPTPPVETEGDAEAPWRRL